MTALEHVGRRNAVTPAQLGQATAVEQARAVAEVQAAVVVAQQIPRDLDRAVADMRDTCGRMAVAAKAFYDVPNRGGQRPSVHLARELARIWGNIDYGVRELRRDDAEGVSEMQAYAWDQQTNTRSSRSFIVPHARMVKKQRQKLDDLTDIYLNNQNIGARAVRESIYTVLPDWLIEEAESICRRTLENGEGVPLPERIDKMVAAFDGIGVTVTQIEDRVGRKRGQWTAADVAQMGVVFASIRSGDTTKDEAFPQARVTAAEITGRRTPEPTTDRSDSPGITSAQSRQMHALLADNSLDDRDDKLAYISGVIGRDVTSSKELSRAEASQVIDSLDEPPAPEDEPPLPGTEGA